jgi:hypothetical protein
MTEDALQARLDFLQREYDALKAQLKAVNWVAPILGALSFGGAPWSLWIPVGGVCFAASIWMATHYIGRTHVLETEERINDTRAHMGLGPVAFKH